MICLGVKFELSGRSLNVKKLQPKANYSINVQVASVLDLIGLLADIGIGANNVLTLGFHEDKVFEVILYHKAKEQYYHKVD